ncbi:MAG TPA: rRNA maturation RNase YbeY [Flavitalea sp.]|nr:rRNA maturation RNase YbeY [Flavitalea sp.]
MKRFILGFFRKEGIQVKTISIIFCSDEYLLKLNKKHLNHDYYTDILTFDLAPKSQPCEAELYISIGRVKENAQQLNVIFSIELLRVIFHGVLHLAGYHDKKQVEQQAMRVMEDKLLTKFLRST